MNVDLSGPALSRLLPALVNPKGPPTVFDHALHAYLRALVGSCAVRRVGPFLVSLDEHDAGLFRNYAIPDDGAEPTQGQVADLVAVFTNRDRTPRLEYLPGLCPEVEPGLVAAGFTPERRLPVMTCAPTTVKAPAVPDGIRLSLASNDVQLRQVAEAQNEAYGQPETTDHDVTRLRSTLDAGGLVAVALDTSTGSGVGGGLCASPHCGISELAAIGVRAPYRNRGIAAALTALLTRACTSVDIATPFLTPAGEAEERIYHSVGYRPATEMLHISLQNSSG
jgi:GNAT superfamily N-acetyltransferase